MTLHTLVQGKKDKELRLAGSLAKPEPFANLVHGTLKGWTTSLGFPCTGAKSAFNIGSYRLGIYKTFSDMDVTELATDLTTYIAEYNSTPAVTPKNLNVGDLVPLDRRLATFLAGFTEEPVCDEVVFEKRLWALLDNLRVADKVAWPPRFSSNPADDNFAFCFGGEGFFVAAFHPGSWRWSRRFMFPLLVLNMHRQFDALRNLGAFDKMRDTIRQNDQDLQGSQNPVVADHGAQPEAAQYAMRKVPSGWSPPGWGG